MGEEVPSRMSGDRLQGGAARDSTARRIAYKLERIETLCVSAARLSRAF